MSSRYLYRKLPASERTCTLCSEPILRNIIQDKNGRLWHYGCWNTARDRNFHCIECETTFDGTEAAYEEIQRIKGDDLQGGLEPVCPSCGSRNFRRHFREDS